MSTGSPSRNIINGSFVGEVELNNDETIELNTRVDQLEREVRGRDAEIRQLTDRVRARRA
jgi:hypothetical protein